MSIEGFNEIQSAMLIFLETKRKDSAVFKAKKKVADKVIAFGKSQEVNRKEKLKKELEELKQSLYRQRKESLSSEIPDWLTTTADKAEEVNKKQSKPMFRNTHPVKFTNPDIEYGGIYVKPSDNENIFLTTDTLKHPYYDISHSNGNLITHSQFLMIMLDGETIYEKLEKVDDLWLQEFSKDKKQIEEWGISLRLWTGHRELKNAIGLKQNYFPVNGNYHMLAPLFSSSICQAIYDRVQDVKFSECSKLMRKAKREGLYKEKILTSYPNMALLIMGSVYKKIDKIKGSNISASNYMRNGKVYLLSCAPPKWQSHLKPPSGKNMFNAEFNHRAWKKTKELQSFLLAVQDKDSNKKIRDHVKNLTLEIINILFNYVAEIQNLTELSGWSKTSNLKQSHKLWLDIDYNNESFKQQRESGDWQIEVCKDFGLWLNKKLEHKKMKGKFAKIESDNWARVLKLQLRKFESYSWELE